MVMNHKFSNASAEVLLSALDALISTPRSDLVGDSIVAIPQIVTIGRYNDDFVITMSDAVDGDTTSGEGVNHRTISSPELSHAIYSMLCDADEAMDAFKLKTGWRKQMKFQFELGSNVAISMSGEGGEVRGRAEYKSGKRQYFIAYMNIHGEFKEDWIDEDLLEGVTD